MQLSEPQSSSGVPPAASESTRYGADLMALIALAGKLASAKDSPVTEISTSLLFFALAVPAYAAGKTVLAGFPAALHFSQALKQLVTERTFEETWHRYFGAPLASVDFAVPAKGGPQQFTQRCRGWLTHAEQRAGAAERGPVTISHLVQAFAAAPAGRYGRLLAEMRVELPMLLAAWERLERGIPAGPAARVFERLVHDQADNVDLMEFNLYATAIASFLTSPDTRGPISISIQAPWGAGKSSLMHQVRHKLDPGHGARPDGKRLSTGRVRAFLHTIKALRTPAVQLPVTEATPPQEQRLTVWFNAWKYESSEQVWAGLVDAIITQVSSRLRPADRELFLLRLNLARIDDGKVRQLLQDRVVAYWWAGARWIVPAALGIPAALFAYFQFDAAPLVAWSGSGAMAALLACLGWARQKVSAEPATFSLSEYVRVPDYGKSAGVIHQIHEDLQRVVEVLPCIDQPGGKGPAPLVIFVDDLDRCSPNKVASVVEGINTFLAGDQHAFIFVIGMDPQMVAAALEHAHKDVKHYLPSHERNAPLGWRFMDKFIQLAFTIPQRHAAAIADYVAVLAPLPLANQASPEPDEPQPHSPSGKGTSTPEEVAAKEAAAEVRQRAASQKITNESEEVGAVIRGITRDFSFSPRDIKRILNFVRFVLLLRQGRIARGLAVPVLASYQRWIVLCIRWPDLARYLQWGADVPPGAVPEPGLQGSTAGRLHALEQAALPPGDVLSEWEPRAAVRLGLPDQTSCWLADPALHRFFVMVAALPADERLSHGASVGFY